MEYFDYSNAPYPIRDDIASACRDYWAKLASPGSWWSGAERIAIAQESRNALTCSLCKVRKEALSPYALEGEHDHSGGLPLLAVDAVHRVITDQTRITQAYVDKNAESGLSKEAYVELVGVVVAVFSIDEFHRSLGLPEESLPVAREGEPTPSRPRGRIDAQHPGTAVVEVTVPALSQCGNCSMFIFAVHHSSRGSAA